MNLPGRTAGAVFAAGILASVVSGAPGRAGAAGNEPGSAPAALVGGSASGTGVFVTYSDKETVIEGGTVVPPAAAVAQAEASVDLTGRASALGALGYSPYVEATGLVNAFAGTDLPLGQLSDRSRAKVSGSPTQESEAPMPGERAAGRARARIVDGPRAEADSAALDGAVPAVSVAVGRSHAVVDTGGGEADTTVAVVLRHVAVGDDLAIDTVRLAVRAVADGAAGAASAAVTIEGATFAGRPVRLTPRGLEPLGPGPKTEVLPSESGVEVLATGSETAEPGGDQSDATATGPRLRLSSPDGRLVEVVIGRATASSTRLPGDHDRDGASAGSTAPFSATDPRARAGTAALPS